MMLRMLIGALIGGLVGWFAFQMHAPDYSHDIDPCFDESLNHVPCTPMMDQRLYKLAPRHMVMSFGVTDSVYLEGTTVSPVTSGKLQLDNVTVVFSPALDAYLTRRVREGAKISDAMQEYLHPAEATHR